MWPAVKRWRKGAKHREHARRYLEDAARAIELADVEIDAGLRSGELCIVREGSDDESRPLEELARKVRAHLVYLGLER